MFFNNLSNFILNVTRQVLTLKQHKFQEEWSSKEEILRLGLSVIVSIMLTLYLLLTLPGTLSSFFPFIFPICVCGLPSLWAPDLLKCLCYGLPWCHMPPRWKLSQALSLRLHVSKTMPALLTIVFPGSSIPRSWQIVNETDVLIQVVSWPIQY